jgi:putative DNA primase/helicase
VNAIIDDHQRIRDALSFIPPTIEREQWFRVGAAIKHEMGADGFELFDTWSRGDPAYIEADTHDTWRSIQAGRGITGATLFAIAKEYGFDPRSHKAMVIDPAEMERRRTERAARAKRDAEARVKQHKQAATLAAVILKKTKPARDDHPYLMRKGLAAISTLREIDVDRLQALIGYKPQSGGDALTGRILIAPVTIGAAVTTVEMIDETGRKSALAGGEKAGGAWIASTPVKTATRYLIAEGVATTLSAHVCTGIPAVAALSSGNLMKVATKLRALHPDVEIIILGDLGNGQQKAVEAAKAIGGRLALPAFGDDRQNDQTDFNDMHLLLGADAVKDRIDAAEVPVDPAHERNAPASMSDGCVPKGFTVFPYRGVFYEEDDGTPHWICSTLHVRALVRDRASENWGRLLEWQDADGHPHVWAMPMEMLRSDGADMRGELARLGLDIAPGNKARNKLTEYVTTAKPQARGRCVTRTGWHAGAFVFPDRTIGESKERVIFQAESVMRAYSQAGTLDDWKQNVARLCSGNSRLLLAVSTAFAGMMLSYSGQESGGLNIVGNSSTGKTTALRAACSVFGPPEYMQRWRATSNGLEGLAALHNDTLLVLDELAQVDPREAGEIAYMLANGSGKARAGRTGAARTRQTWRLLFLSAGEIGLAQHMQAGGKTAKAGQEVRLVEIPADAGAGFGLFETLHGLTGGAELSSTINDACTRSYGTAAIEFLTAVTAEPGIIEQWLKTQTAEFLAANLPADANGQAHRVCQRLALIGLAGEYATNRGITGWTDGEALQAAAKCFSAWLENRGGAGNQERANVLAAVKAFFESHEESRFTDLAAISDRPTINRAGYKRSTDGTVEYLVFPEVFKREVCAGPDPKAAAKMLIEAGWLKPASNGWAQRAERLPGKGPTKVYVFTSSIWEAAQ